MVQTTHTHISNLDILLLQRRKDTIRQFTRTITEAHDSEFLAMVAKINLEWLHLKYLKG